MVGLDVIVGVVKWEYDFEVVLFSGMEYYIDFFIVRGCVVSIYVDSECINFGILGKLYVILVFLDWELECVVELYVIVSKVYIYCMRR